MDKILTFAVPCYNSAAYMDHCVETLLTAGEDIEIILVDDGSVKDDTPQKFPPGNLGSRQGCRPCPHWGSPAG